jgi:hypothetical protein
MEYDMDH